MPTSRTADQSTLLTPEVIAAAEDLGVATHLDAVAQITTELFPGRLSAAVSEDPELPGDSHIVFRVTAKGTIREILDREEQWHRRVLGCTPPRVNVFRICVDAE
jgi:hypothetical protein